MRNILTTTKKNIWHTPAWSGISVLGFTFHCSQGWMCVCLCLRVSCQMWVIFMAYHLLQMWTVKLCWPENLQIWPQQNTHISAIKHLLLTLSLGVCVCVCVMQVVTCCVCALFFFFSQSVLWVVCRRKYKMHMNVFHATWRVELQTSISVYISV